MEEIIIHCPTEELWVKVQEKMFKDGYQWSIIKRNLLDLGYWEEEKSNTCILGKEDGEMEYCYREWYEVAMPGVKVIEGKKFLGAEQSYDKLLRDSGMKDDSGNYTAAYREVRNFILDQEYEAKVVEQVKAKLEEEKEK